jgi:hypothetical protein
MSYSHSGVLGQSVMSEGVVGVSDQSVGVRGFSGGDAGVVGMTSNPHPLPAPSLATSPSMAIST